MYLVVRNSRKNPNDYTNITVLDSFKRKIPISNVF